MKVLFFLLGIASTNALVPQVPMCDYDGELNVYLVIT